MKRKHTHPRNAGFTLIETMITVVIIGILAGLTIPNLMNYFSRSRIRGARTELMADMAYARSLAIARRTTFRMDIAANNYRIVQSSDGTTVRSRTAPNGVTFSTTTNPQFYPYGLSDAASVIVQSGANDSTVNLLPNGTATHD